MSLNEEEIIRLAGALVENPEFMARITARAVAAAASKIDVPAERDRLQRQLRAEVDTVLKESKWKTTAMERLDEAVTLKIDSVKSNIDAKIDAELLNFPGWDTNRVESLFKRAVDTIVQKRVHEMVTNIQRNLDGRIIAAVKSALHGVEINLNMSDIFNRTEDTEYDD